MRKREGSWPSRKFMVEAKNLFCRLQGNEKNIGVITTSKIVFQEKAMQCNIILLSMYTHVLKHDQSVMNKIYVRLLHIRIFPYAHCPENRITEKNCRLILLQYRFNEFRRCGQLRIILSAQYYSLFVILLLVRQKVFYSFSKIEYLMYM